MATQIELSTEDQDIAQSLVDGGVYPDLSSAVAALITHGKTHPHIIALLDRINEAAVSKDYLRTLVEEHAKRPSDVVDIDDGFAQIEQNLRAYAASKA